MSVGNFVNGVNWMLVRTLLKNFEAFKGEPSLEAKADLALQICTEFNEHGFTEKERDIIKEILTVLAEDAEIIIRKTLSETLKENDDLPHDVAVRLANDIADVSMPILEFSTVLTDEDLEEVINNAGDEVRKLISIAKRVNVSETITSRLVSTDSKEIIKTLMSNHTATVSEKSYSMVVKTFGESESVMGAMIKRGDLNVELAEKIVSKVSVNLQEKLISKYGVSPRTALSSIKETREKVTLSTIAKNADRSSTIDLIHHMYRTGKLSHSIVLRGLCRADLEFFQAGIAKLASIPEYNVSVLINKGDVKGINALLRAASIPSTMIEATEILLSIMADNKLKADSDPKESLRIMLGTIMKEEYDKKVPNMRYFIALIRSGISEEEEVIRDPSVS